MFSNYGKARNPAENLAGGKWAGKLYELLFLFFIPHPSLLDRSLGDKRLQTEGRNCMWCLLFHQWKVSMKWKLIYQSFLVDGKFDIQPGAPSKSTSNFQEMIQRTVNPHMKSILTPKASFAMLLSQSSNRKQNTEETVIIITQIIANIQLYI